MSSLIKQEINKKVININLMFLIQKNKKYIFYYKCNKTFLCLKEIGTLIINIIFLFDQFNFSFI